MSLEVFGGGHLEVVPGRKSMRGNNTVTMCTYFVIKSENEANEILAETIHYVHAVGTVNFYPVLPEWATKDCRVRMYIPASGTPYSRQEDLIQSLDTHQDDLRKQLYLIREQMEHCLKYRCGEWATTIAEQIMEDVK